MTEPAPFADRLMAWWDRHGRHDLPWQHPRTPYRVWISEVMLQQTQVATVIPYFQAWMQRFPDLASLAGAGLDEVLALWSGLGYYARARNLHRAARRCMETHGGRLPESPGALAGLPGIGESTANAIASQAHDRPLPILDGNVRRVLARHAAVPGWPGQAAVQKRLWREAAKRLPARRGADYSQAIMDLGATVCTRSRPDCAACPVGDDCLAHRNQAVGRFPQARPRTAVRDVTIHLLLVRRADRAVLLERRPRAGIWGGLWCLPEASSVEGLAERFGLEPARMRELPRFEHRLTHRRLRIRPWAICSEAGANGVESDPERRWARAGELDAIGLPRPVRDLLNRLAEEPMT